MTTPADLTDQVQRADQAFRETRDTTPRERAAWLEAMAVALEQHDRELIALAQDESHLPEPRLRGELARTAFQLRLLAKEVTAGEHLDATIDHADPDWGMGPRPDLRRVNVPLGVVGVFGASNFPFAFSVIGGDSASALAAGCAVVHKIHEAHPRLGRRTGEIVIAALEGAGAPSGLFSTVTGRPAGELLVDHALVQAVGFTGSPGAGRALFDRAARRPQPIPFYGELGSINPAFVTQRAWAARSEEILTGFVGSFTMGAGQFCTKPGLLFTPRLSERDVEQLRGAIPQPAALLNDAIADGYGRALEEARATPGVEVLVAGSTGASPAPTLLLTTTDVAREHPELVRREVFGPASVVVQYDSQDDLPDLVALLEGQLTATVHAEPGEDLGDLRDALARISGRLVRDAWPTGVTVSHAQHHGGPYPATTAAGTTSVGTAAIGRFLRPVAYQGFAQEDLPPALREDNPWSVPQRINGRRPAG